MSEGPGATGGQGAAAELQARRRRQRNIAIAAVLVGLVVVFYLITIVKLGPGALVKY